MEHRTDRYGDPWANELARRVGRRPAKHRHFTLQDFVLLVALAVLAGFFSRGAHADTKTVSWTNATTNVDGSAIPASGPGSLARTTVEYGSCVGNPKAFGTKVGEIFVAAPANTLQLALVVVQEYCLRAFHSNTYAMTFALSQPGNSGPSNVASTVVPPPTPNTPTTLTISGTITGTLTITPGGTTTSP